MENGLRNYTPHAAVMHDQIMGPWVCMRSSPFAGYWAVHTFYYLLWAGYMQPKLAERKL